MSRPEFAGLPFIGSAATCKELQGEIGKGTAAERYNQFSRVVGETGGNTFHAVHQSTDIRSASFNTLRDAFEYQGQKCSSTSRVYVAESGWPEFKRHVQEETAKMKIGPTVRYDNFLHAVIHEHTLGKLNLVIESAKSDKELELVGRGKADKSTSCIPKSTRPRDPTTPSRGENHSGIYSVSTC